MKLSQKQPEIKKSAEEVLQELREKVKTNAKKLKDRQNAACPYGCPWNTTNKYRKYVTEPRSRKMKNFKTRRNFKMFLKKHYVSLIVFF